MNKDDADTKKTGYNFRKYDALKISVKDKTLLSHPIFQRKIIFRKVELIFVMVQVPVSNQKYFLTIDKNFTTQMKLHILLVLDLLNSRNKKP